MFRHRFTTRFDELDFFGHLNNAVYADYLWHVALDILQQVCGDIAGSTRAPYAWCVQSLAIRYHRQLRALEQIEVQTQLAAEPEGQFVLAHTMQRAADAAPVVEAKQVLQARSLDAGTAVALPGALQPYANRTLPVDNLSIRLRRRQETRGAHRYRTQRRVQIHELDLWGHVSAATLLRWIAQAYFDALRACGHPIEGWHDLDRLVVQGGHELQLFAAVSDAAEIEVVSWICELARVRGAWIHEIYDLTAGRRVARDYSLGVFVNHAGQPAALPESMLADAVYGGAARKSI